MPRESSSWPSAPEIEHRGNMSVSAAETRALTAEQTMSATQRRLEHVEAELETSKTRLQGRIERSKLSGTVLETRNRLRLTLQICAHLLTQKNSK